jgi:pimeloyl-ACP methyl ester carboxylesterase
MLLTADGERLDAAHHPQARTGAGPERELAVVLAHGFCGSWRNAKMATLARAVTPHAGVLSFDFRGHGRSSGVSTVGDFEVLDLDAVVRWARLQGYAKVATVGWSMGGSIVVRHAGLHGGVDAVVSVSAPSRWFYRDTAAMRRVHLAIEYPVGRVVARTLLRTRIASSGWEPPPEPPMAVAPRIAPTPLLVVHGLADRYLPHEHGQALYDAAGEPRELWLVEGLGHAERGATPALVDRIVRWVRARVKDPSGGRPS